MTTEPEPIEPESTEDNTPPWVKDGTKPTPEDWVNWFLQVPAREKIDLATLALRFSDESTSCFQMDHEGRIANLTDQNNRHIQTIQQQADYIKELQDFISGITDRVDAMRAGIHNTLNTGHLYRPIVTGEVPE